MLAFEDAMKSYMFSQKLMDKENMEGLQADLRIHTWASDCHSHMRRTHFEVRIYRLGEFALEDSSGKKSSV